eukprot:scaffold11820_cov189-Ochromonas_danica.AAC.2
MVSPYEILIKIPVVGIIERSTVRFSFLEISSSVDESAASFRLKLLISKYSSGWLPLVCLVAAWALLVLLVIVYQSSSRSVVDIHQAHSYAEYLLLPFFVKQRGYLLLPRRTSYVQQAFLQDVVHMNAKQTDVLSFSLEHYAVIIQAFFVSNITESCLQVLFSGDCRGDGTSSSNLHEVKEIPFFTSFNFLSRMAYGSRSCSSTCPAREREDSNCSSSSSSSTTLRMAYTAAGDVLL